MLLRLSKSVVLFGLQGLHTTTCSQSQPLACRALRLPFVFVLDQTHDGWKQDEAQGGSSSDTPSLVNSGKDKASVMKPRVGVDRR